MDERWCYNHITVDDGVVIAWDETDASPIYVGTSVVEAVARLIAYGMFLEGRIPRYLIKLRNKR